MCNVRYVRDAKLIREITRLYADKPPPPMILTAILSKRLRAIACYLVLQWSLYTKIIDIPREVKLFYETRFRACY